MPQQRSGCMKTKFIEHSLNVLIFVICILAIYTYGFLIKSNGDNVEHLQSSWLIWQSYIPYKDYFQHHNPLIWYVFSPLVALLIDDINIFKVFNAISVLGFIATVYVIAKILILNNLSKINVQIFSLITLSSFSLLCSMDYRPDTFMYLFFFMGIYYWFSYKKTPKLENIAKSFLCFFLSFLCSQKILLNLGVIGLIIIYEVCSKKIKKEDFFLSLLLPISLFLLMLAYFYTNDALEIYLKSNYYFNSYIPTIFYNHRTSIPPFIYYEFFIFVPIGFVGAIYFLLKGNNNEKIISLLFVEEFLLRFFYFSAFLHYNALILLLSMMIVIMFVVRFSFTQKALSIIFIPYILFAIFYNYQNTYIPEYNRKDYKGNYEYVFENTSYCDYVINGYYAVYNLRGKNPGFYSILLGQIDVLGAKLGIAPKDDFNALVLKYKPKIISGGVYWDTYKEERGKKIPIHYIQQELIKQYYDYSNKGDLFILKPEYQKHNCKYNGTRWEYID